MVFCEFQQSCRVLFGCRLSTFYFLDVELFIRLTVCVFGGHWSNFVYVLLSILVLRVGCVM